MHNSTPISAAERDEIVSTIHRLIHEADERYAEQQSFLKMSYAQLCAHIEQLRYRTQYMSLATPTNMDCATPSRNTTARPPAMQSGAMDAMGNGGSLYPGAAGASYMAGLGSFMTGAAAAPPPRLPSAAANLFSTSHNRSAMANMNMSLAAAAAANGGASSAIQDAGSEGNVPGPAGTSTPPNKQPVGLTGNNNNSNNNNGGAGLITMGAGRDSSAMTGPGLGKTLDDPLATEWASSASLMLSGGTQESMMASPQAIGRVSLEELFARFSNAAMGGSNNTVVNNNNNNSAVVGGSLANDLIAQSSAAAAAAAVGAVEGAPHINFDSLYEQLTGNKDEAFADSFSRATETISHGGLTDSGATESARPLTQQQQQQQQPQQQGNTTTTTATNAAHNAGASAMASSVSLYGRDTIPIDAFRSLHDQHLTSAIKAGYEQRRPTVIPVSGQARDDPARWGIDVQCECKVLVEFKRKRVLQYESTNYVAPGSYVVVGGDRGEDLGLVIYTWCESAGKAGTQPGANTPPPPPPPASSSSLSQSKHGGKKTPGNNAEAHSRVESALSATSSSSLTTGELLTQSNPTDSCNATRSGTNTLNSHGNTNTAGGEGAEGGASGNPATNNGGNGHNKVVGIGLAGSTLTRSIGVGNGTVLRLATESEVQQLHGTQTELERRAIDVCAQRVLEHGLPMVIVDAEYQFDKKKLTFFYEAQQRLDFRELVRDLYKTFRARIWMELVDN